jgi:hypothetical protein
MVKFNVVVRAMALSMLAASCLAFADARAAEIRSEALPSGGSLITVRGEIVAGDLAKFRRVALETDQAVVWLASPGGVVSEAVEIGRIVRLKGYSTLVTSDVACSSACGIIWLAGQTRNLEEGARVGFHAAYVDGGGDKRETGVGNAVVGSYYASLGLSERAIVFATSASPSAMNWLTLDNAKAAGIEVSAFDASAKAMPDARASEEGQNARIVGSSGTWVVGVDDSLGKGCFLLAEYDGLSLRIGLDMREPARGYFMVMGDAWTSIEEGKEYETQVVFGERKPWTGPALGVEMGELRGVMLAIDDPDFFDEFEKSKVVRVIYKDRDVAKLDIEGSRAAVRSMWDCQRTAAKPDPFAR